MELKAISTTEAYFRDTHFIIEFAIADSAKETATDKVTRLILNNLDEALKKAA